MLEDSVSDDKDKQSDFGESCSLARRAQGADRWLGLVILLSTVLLIAGWTLPMMTVDRLLILTEQVSILQGCLVLWSEGEYFLFAVIALFSIVFPLVKLGLALFLWYRADAASPALQRSLGCIESLGKWSMLDVFAVALIVVAIQVSIITDVTVHAGAEGELPPAINRVGVVICA